MKVLFVCSGNKADGPGAVVANQAQSLKNAGVEIDYYLIKGKGIKGYLQNIKGLKKQTDRNKYDVIHAHGISSIVATFAMVIPLVVSLLGSELNESSLIRRLIRFMAAKRWNHTIVKSQDMELKLKLKNNAKISIIPNGVDTELNRPIDKNKAREAVKLADSDKIVLWLADPARKSKNFELAEKAVEMLNQPEIRLLQIHNVQKERVFYYLNAADVVLLTSRWEGSPNIIKEAMACNRPIVATDVGDIKWLFGDEPGHFITGFEPEDVADKIKKAIEFSDKQGETRGRKRIEVLKLDSVSVASRISDIYNKVIER